ncbi:MAG: pyridoxal 5'-phosphate synthase glutaminase subunit PdxT [Chitinophagales bacterium]
MAGKKTVGVLALQGAFAEHQNVLKRCGVGVHRVRSIDDLASIDGLIIPGGESTTIGKLLVDFKLADRVIELARGGMPVFGTCAGMIVMAREIPGHDQYSLGLMDISAKRNAFGRQVESFEADLDVKGISKKVKGIFIRAPYVDRVWGDAKILCEYQDKIVMVKQHNLLASAFHPELTKDLTVHNYFLEML